MKENKEKLEDFKTCELVAELKTREGVDCAMVEPYQQETLDVEGPAIILTVID
jgi:hypothetical protein|nr:MAG TPA: hypothetical protein [Caudoviricetes sp.]